MGADGAALNGRLTSPEVSEKKQLVLKSWTRVHAGT